MFFEEILAGIDGAAEQHGKCTAGHTHYQCAEQRNGGDGVIDGRHGEQRIVAKKEAAQHARSSRGHGYRHKRARAPFKQQQFNGEQNSGERRGKHARHARCRTRHQQRGALGVREVKELAQQQSPRTPRS